MSSNIFSAAGGEVTASDGPRSLARVQADLVAAVTGTGPVPDGFDHGRIEIARKALLRKRWAGIATTWPALAQTPAAFPAFAEWARDRPTQGALRDGWDLALHLSSSGALPRAARIELAEHAARWRYDGRSAPVGRRGPVLVRRHGVLVARWGRWTAIRP